MVQENNMEENSTYTGKDGFKTQPYMWRHILSSSSWTSSVDNKTSSSVTFEDSDRWIHVDDVGRVRHIFLRKALLVDRLRLRYRDLVVVDPTIPVPMGSVIFVRPKAIVVNLDVGGTIRMIICENQCFILGLPSESDTAITVLPTKNHPFVQILSERLRHASKHEFEDGLEMPYEFVALEIALNAAVGILKRDIECFEDDAMEKIEAMLVKVDKNTLEGIRMVKNHVDWLQTKVSKLQSELKELLEDDVDMLDLYLSRRAENEGEKPLSQPRMDEFSQRTISEEEQLDSTSQQFEFYRDSHGQPHSPYCGDKKSPGSVASEEQRRRQPLAYNKLWMLGLRDGFHGKRRPRGRRKRRKQQRKKEHKVKPNITLRGSRGEVPSRQDEDDANHDSEKDFLKQKDDLMSRETLQQIDKMLGSLKPQVDPHDIEEAEDLLEVFFVNLDLLLRRLQTLDERVEDAEDFLELDLDSRRNQLVALSVIIAAISMSFGFAAVIAGIFGMNLVNSDLVNEAWVLPVVLVITFALSVALILAIVWYLRKKQLMFIPQKF